MAADCNLCVMFCRYSDQLLNIFVHHVATVYNCNLYRTITVTSIAVTVTCIAVTVTVACIVILSHPPKCLKTGKIRANYGLFVVVSASNKIRAIL